MDWGRAKNVLIYAFLLLNLVLGYQIWMDARETAGANLDFTSLADNTQQAMEEKGIQVLAPIPNETPKLPKLSYEFIEDNKAGIEVELEKHVDSKLIFSQSELEDALQDEIPQIGTYRLDQLMAEDGAFVLHPLVDGKWPLFNVSLELFYSDQKITGYRQTPVRITTAEESDQQVLPASKALGTLIENFCPMMRLSKIFSWAIMASCSIQICRWRCRHGGSCWKVAKCCTCRASAGMYSVPRQTNQGSNALWGYILPCYPAVRQGMPRLYSMGARPS